MCSCILSGAGLEGITTPVLSAGPKYQRQPVSLRPSPMSTATLGPRIQDPSVFTVTDRRVSTGSDKSPPGHTFDLRALRMEPPCHVAEQPVQPALPWLLTLQAMCPSGAGVLM